MDSDLLAVGQWDLVILLLIKTSVRVLFPALKLLKHLCVKTHKPETFLCSSGRVLCRAEPHLQLIQSFDHVASKMNCAASLRLLCFVFFFSHKVPSITMQQHHTGKSSLFAFLKKNQHKNNKYLLDINNEFLDWIWQVATHSHTNVRAHTRHTHWWKIKLCLQGVWISSHQLHIQNVWMETCHQGPRRGRVVVSSLTTASAARGADEEIKLWNE